MKNEFGVMGSEFGVVDTERAIRSSWVASFTASISAPETALLWGSYTLPEIAPVPGV